ncbi:1-acyl-sn-glycerol-3-phosphate acyltransferase alpha-like isoform X1 [Mercenaria mercenaria]|uniref:1-acyl-sn-glycerol-3-phosphate acyltransferase alpha-like isoform X1 n=1 Tax=Mercenaria mercenaria TaxID=6596 RepID=UPI00234F15C3|nr:1-acyl-sn-glycerol-3-phosphate acyltransferase alpha-like isoform X1 [Mercenaria mercenaria]
MIQTKRTLANMALELFHWFIIGFLLILPILYELSGTFRYHAKFALYYACIFGIATVVCLYGWLRPGDVNNHWFILWAMNHVKNLFGIEVEVRGEENLKSDKPFILVINHQSSLDCIGMTQIWPSRCCCLVKNELKYAGPFGLAALLCGTVFIDRLNKEKALDTMKKTVGDIKSRNVKLLVFPEGTRNHDGSMMPFKKGAFHLAVQAQIPVVPVVFSSFSEFYNKKDKKFTTGKFIITCLPSVSTRGLTSNDVTDLTENVRKQMLDTFNQTSFEATQNKLASKITNGTK